MDLIAALRSFLRVAETGSFSAVALERGVTQPAISRQITALEQHLGTRLVQRSTQAVALTEEGRDLVAAARQAVEAADAVLQATSHRRGKPVGRVRVGVSVAFGAYLISRFGRLSAPMRIRVSLMVLSLFREASRRTETSRVAGSLINEREISIEDATKS